MATAKPPVKISSLFHGIPEILPDELFETLLQTPGFRLERIVSRRHATPPGTWFDQSMDEWVLMLAGRAGLRFENPDLTLEMQPGEHLLIPAGRRHRVEWTDPDRDTVWLALYYPPP